MIGRQVVEVLFSFIISLVSYGQGKRVGRNKEKETREN